jgi:hypothetical protein
MGATKLNGVGIKSNSPKMSSDRGWLIPISVLFGSSLLGAFIWWILSDVRQTQYNEIYLLPWIILSAVVILTPSAILFYQNKFDIFHPLASVRNGCEVFILFANFFRLNDALRFCALCFAARNKLFLCRSARTAKNENARAE